MPRSSIWFVTALVVLAGTSIGLFVQNRRTHVALGDARAREEATHDRYESAIGDISAIQDSLNAITFADGKTALRSSDLSAERRLSPKRTDEALARVAELRSGIERTRERIVDLEDRIHKSGARVAGLERLVARLRTGLTDKENMVQLLTHRIDSLSTHVGMLTATAAEREAMLEERRRELGTVFYLVGTRRELLRSGAVVARGGVLGIGRSLNASGQVDESRFQRLDTDETTVIPIASKRARVLTPQPVGSYRLEPTETGLNLRILNVREFRKVRHLLILTA